MLCLSPCLALPSRPFLILLGLGLGLRGRLGPTEDLEVLCGGFSSWVSGVMLLSPRGVGVTERERGGRGTGGGFLTLVDIQRRIFLSVGVGPGINVAVALDVDGSTVRWVSYVAN